MVQVALGGPRHPLFDSSALLSILAHADGHLVVTDAATRLSGGTKVEVTLYR